MIKIAQIGTSHNSHGPDIFNCIKSLPDIFEIVGYALPENEREKFPQRMPVFEGYREMTVDEILNDPEIDAVLVETEEIYLTKYAQLVADHKKHMHMEKPGGINLADFEKLIETVKKNKTVFHTGYMYRYNPYITDLMKRIKAGELGEIISVEAQMNSPHPLELRKWLSTFPGGVLFFLGCHLIDLILQIQGMPEKIIPLSKSTGLDGVDGKDFGMVALEYKHGISFAKTSSTEWGGFTRRQLVVCGTKGTVEIRPLELIQKAGMQTTEYREISDYNWTADSDFNSTSEFNRYKTMMKSFAAMVRKEKENPWTYDYELELYRTILKCCE